MATGVLPICIGRAAKTADLNPVSDKRYRATFRLWCDYRYRGRVGQGADKERKACYACGNYRCGKDYAGRYNADTADVFCGEDKRQTAL
ncbi:MAG: hypothetical protein ACLS48_05940 [[Eubacterium] siraeum]